jgi:hypothetical protein
MGKKSSILLAVLLALPLIMGLLVYLWFFLAG